MALSLLLLTGCAKEAVGVPYNYVLPFASLRVYVGCQSEVYIDGTIYGTTPSGILTQNSGPQPYTSRMNSFRASHRWAGLSVAALTTMRLCGVFCNTMESQL